MAQPVHYILRDPFFISSRLMPAITVADTTIHLQAHAIDHEDDHDPRVVWEYLIDGPDVHYAARDLTTPYLGPSAVDSQLPTAMGTLLMSLSHLGDADNPDTVDEAAASALQQWASRHQDEIAVAAELVHIGRRELLSATQVWRAITHDPYQTQYGHWCAGQVAAHADRIATLNPRGVSTSTVTAVRDEVWHEAALAWYRVLTDRPEPEPEPAPASLCTVADRDAITAWLETTAPHPYAGTVAEFLSLGDAPPQSRMLPDLIEHAQLAGLFGVALHTIRMHNVVDPDTGRAGHLLTIHGPHHADLAVGPLDTHDLIRGRHGPDAAVSILQDCATCVDGAFTDHAAWAHGPTPGHGRAFPSLHTGPPATAVAPPVPPAPGTRSSHHR